jgi:hypothetical protein
LDRHFGFGNSLEDGAHAITLGVSRAEAFACKRLFLRREQNRNGQSRIENW